MKLSSVGRHIVIWIAIVVALFPIAWMTSMAFKPPLEWTSAAGTVSWLPKEPTLANFEYIFTGKSSAYPSSTLMERTALWPILSSLLISTVATHSRRSRWSNAPFRRKDSALNAEGFAQIVRTGINMR